MQAVRILVAIVAALAVSLSAQPTHLTDIEIEAAIARTKERRFESSFVQARGRFLSDFTVIVQGPIGRTMDVAREAFDAFKPVTVAMVPREVAERQVTVLVMTRIRTERVVTNVVIMPPNATSRDDAIQSVRRDRTVYDPLPRTWRPGYGDAYDSLARRSYRFDESVLPGGDITIVVATNNGQETFTVRAQDRERVR